MRQTNPNINVMMKAARKASRKLLRDFGEVENLQVSSKSVGDFVTKADIKSENIIKNELLESRPNYGWVGEESDEIIGKDNTRRWIVDPLDGTTNFIHGIPHWSISIGLEYKREIVSSVIYDPIRDEMFYAQKGEGAWINDKRLRVSDRTNFSDMLFATGIPYANSSYLENSLQEMESILPLCAGIRRNGSAALDLAYVAAGRFDGYWERGLKIWDIAAGVLILKEAGGLIEDIKENGNFIESGDIICSNNKCFVKFSSIIRGNI
tara:strand:+ start:104 stop:898 length:795 start_codon:yes stop_codon:yes gene_type:complete